MNKNKLKHLKHYGKFSCFNSNNNINPQFRKVKIFIAYDGYNRNNTHISKEVFEQMIPSLYNIPIVGEWKEHNDNFGSHGGKIELSDEGYKEIRTTMPYGVIPESSDVHWELVKGKDGVERNYLTATGYLWVGRYPELQKVIDDGANQSMEIEIEVGDYNENENIFYINQAIFSALCLLGKDEDLSKNVEPCFEDARVDSYSKNNESFTLQYQEMLSELNKSFNSDTIVSNIIDKLKEEFEIIPKGVQVDMNKDKEFTEEVDEKVDNTEDFKAPKDEDEKGKDEKDKDNKETKPKDEDSDEDKKKKEDKAKEKGEKSEVDKTPTEDFEAKYNTLLATYGKLNEDYNKLVIDVDAYKLQVSELEDLKAYKQAKEIEEKAEYDIAMTEMLDGHKESLSEEEFAKFTAMKDTLSIEDINDKICSHLYQKAQELKGKNKNKFSKAKTKTPIVPVTKFANNEDASANAYGEWSK